MNRRSFFATMTALLLPKPKHPVCIKKEQIVAGTLIARNILMITLHCNTRTANIGIGEFRYVSRLHVKGGVITAMS